MACRTATGERAAPGFTLVELLVVLAIIATLASIAVPRYFNSLEKSREVALRSNLKVMREALDQFHEDSGRWPRSIEDLVKQRYLREIPVDPITQDARTWVVVYATDRPDGGVRDVRSGAPGGPREGPPYEAW